MSAYMYIWGVSNVIEQLCARRCASLRTKPRRRVSLHTVAYDICMHFETSFQKLALTYKYWNAKRDF